MKTLKPELLSAGNFAGYGNIIDTTATNPISINSGNCLRYSDLATLDIDNSGNAGISVFDAKPYASPVQINYLERHPLGSQAFIPMTTDPYLVIVADDLNGAAQQPKVFITNGKQGVNYHRNTWHGVLTPIHKDCLFTVVDYIGDADNLEEFYFDTPYLIHY